MASRVEEDIKGIFINLKEGCTTGYAFFNVSRPTEDCTKLCLPFLLNETFGAYTNEERKVAVKFYIRCIAQEFVPVVIANCLEFFNALIQAGIVTAKNVCDELLQCHEELMKNPVFFNEAALLIEKVVHQIDYKGCRDIFAKVLSLCKFSGDSDEKVFQPAFRIISTLMDRSQCLMPAYFALHEVTKLTPMEQNQLHPTLKEKLSLFRNSFKNVSSLFVHKVFKQIVPIAGVNNYCLHSPVGHSQSGGSANLPVNLVPSTGALDLKGPLPYDTELTQGRSELLRCLLIQHAGMDLLLSVLGFTNRSGKPPRCLFLEKCLIDTILWAVDETETCKEEAELAWADALWRHLGLCSIHLCRFHLVRFPELCQGLHDGVKQRPGGCQQSRGRIAWLLFNFFGAQHKNPLGDFALILRILDLLFPEGPRSFDTSLLIWFNLTHKSSANELLPRCPPPQLRPMITQLTERFQVMSQSASYQVSLEPQQFKWFAYIYNAYAPLAQSQVVSPLNSKLVEALKSDDSRALPFASLRQLAVMSLIAINSLLQSLLQQSTDCRAVLETYARTTVLIHHDLNLQPKSVLQEVYKASNPQPTKFSLFVVELSTFQLFNVEPQQRQALTGILVTAAKGNRMTTDMELCLYRQLQLLFTPAVQLTPNHVKKVCVSWVCGSDQEELNRYLLLQLQHQLVQQQTDPDGSLLAEFVQPLFQKCSSACQLPQSMRAHFRCERLMVPERCVGQQQQKEVAVICQRFLQDGHCDEAQVQQSGCLYTLALRCLAERGDLAGALFSRLHESLGPRGCMTHLRLFCDLLVLELSGLDEDAGRALLNHVTSLVYAHRLLPLHRLALALVMRPYGERRLELMAFRVLGHVLSPAVPGSPMPGVVEVLKRAPAGTSLAGLVSQLSSSFDDAVPSVLYGHAVTRLIVVLDCVLARLLQLQPDTIEELLDTLAPLLRHYPNPVTCCLTLLTVYGHSLSERLKLKVTQVLLTPRIEAAPDEAYLTARAERHLRSFGEHSDELDDREPLNRLGECLRSLGRRGFPQLDWAQHEFPGALPHAVNCCALQQLLCPKPIGQFGSGVDWNAAGLLVAQLPQQFAQDLVYQPVLGLMDEFGRVPPEQFFSQASGRPQVSMWLAFMSHAGPGRVCRLPHFFRHSLLPRVANESQLLLACQLTGPLLSDLLRSHNSVQNDLVTELYHCLAKVGASSALHQQDAVADFFYHIKYMFVGDGVRKTAAAAIERLSPGLQRRLRSIAPQQHAQESAEAQD